MRGDEAGRGGGDTVDIAQRTGDPGDPVARMLAPIGLADFLATDFGRTCVHIPGDPARFSGLASWEGVNRALESHRLQPPRLQLVRGGKAIPTGRYKRQVGGESYIDAGRVMALLDQGVTLTFGFVDEIFPPVAHLADAVAAALNAHVNVNLYAGWRRESGFDLHWDRHEVFVLQVAGRKHWTIHPPTKEAPHGRDPEAPPVPSDAPAFDKVIEAGDLLYIPRGWWHNATPLDEASLHLTLAVAMPDAQHLLDWLGRRLSQHSVGRRDVPVHGGADALDLFRRDLMTAIEGLSMSDFLADWRAGRRARPRFSLPVFPRPRANQITRSTRVRLANQRGLAPIAHPVTGEATIETHERSWPCSSAVGAALARLSSTTDITVAELAAGLGAQQESELLKLLQGLTLCGELYCDMPHDPD